MATTSKEKTITATQTYVNGVQDRMPSFRPAVVDATNLAEVMDSATREAIAATSQDNNEGTNEQEQATPTDQAIDRCVEEQTMPTTQSCENGPRCGFLSLPAELRNRIYAYALTGEQAIKIFLMNKAYYKAVIQPPLTRACRQMRHDSFEMVYELSTFLFRCSMHQLPTLDIHPIRKHLHQLRNIEIETEFCQHVNSFHLDVSNGLASYKLRIGRTYEEVSDDCSSVRYLTEARAYLDSCISGDNPATSLTQEIFETLLKILLRQT